MFTSSTLKTNSKLLSQTDTLTVASSTVTSIFKLNIQSSQLIKVEFQNNFLFTPSSHFLFARISDFDKHISNIYSSSFNIQSKEYHFELHQGKYLVIVMNDYSRLNVRESTEATWTLKWSSKNDFYFEYFGTDDTHKLLIKIWNERLFIEYDDTIDQRENTAKDKEKIYKYTNGNYLDLGISVLFCACNAFNKQYDIWYDKDEILKLCSSVLLWSDGMVYRNRNFLFVGKWKEGVWMKDVEERFTISINNNSSNQRIGSSMLEEIDGISYDSYLGVFPLTASDYSNASDDNAWTGARTSTIRVQDNTSALLDQTANTTMNSITTSLSNEPQNGNEANVPQQIKISFPITQENKSANWTTINYLNAIYLGAINQNQEKHGDGCLFYSENEYSIGTFKNDLLNGQGKSFLNKHLSYSGEYKDGVVNGVGVQYYTNNDKYIGNFICGVFHGLGLLKFSTGNEYFGTFEKGWQSGVGKFIYKSGEMFLGYFSGGEMTGFGISINADKGENYEGDFLNGERTGFGTLTFDGDLSIYQGEFSHGKFNGIGLLIDKNGDVYSGEFKQGMRDGLGILKLTEGDIYEGDFVQGKLTGFGKLTIMNGVIEYSGEFKDGKYHGQGTWITDNNDTYIGEFFDGAKQGTGIYSWGNGDYYEGSFEKDMLNGLGKYYNKNGNVYIGYFSNGVYNGQGELRFHNGDKYIGNFNNGIREGNGIFYFGEGDVYDGEFKDELFHGEGVLYKGNGDFVEGSFEKGLISGKATFYPKDGEPYDIDTNDDDF